jgi:DNA-binding NarL/FixJ family response regulator
MSSLIKVLIVDDHTLFNDGLAAMLSSVPEIKVYGQVYDARNTLRDVQINRPDVVILDFNMPKINGLELTHQLLKGSPELKILILSMYNEPRFLEDFKAAGARGYVLKTTELKKLVGIIQKVADGGLCFDSNDRPLQADSIHSSDEFLKKIRLTPREIEILKLIKTGLTNQQIAQQIFLSQLTVQTHRRNVHFKLGIKGEADLIRWLEKNEL